MSKYSTCTKWVICIGLGLFATGCSSVPQSPVGSALCREPAGNRKHVHVVVVESPIDVAQAGKLPQLADYIRSCGICNVHEHSMYREGSGKWITQKLKQIRCNDPCARIIVVGWSSGTMIALRALEDCPSTYVDTLVHLDSFVLDMVNRKQRPRNVGRVVCIYRRIAKPKNIPCDAVYLVDEYNHLRLPSRQRAVDALMTEIRCLARNPRCAGGA